MEVSIPKPPETKLARQRAQIRRSMLRVSTAGVVVVLVVVGLAVGAVLAAFRARENGWQAKAATARAEEELRNAYLAQSRAGRLNAVMGRKEEGLAAVTAAARIRPELEARNEAIAHFALMDLRDEGLRWEQRGSGYRVVFDAAMDIFAAANSTGTELVIGKVADQQILCRYVNPLARIERLLKFSPDGRHLAIACANQTLMLFDVTAQRPAFRVKAPERVRGFSFSPNGALAAFVHTDGSVRVARTADGEEVRRLKPDGRPSLVQFDAAGKHLAISAGARLQVMDWEQQKTLSRLTHDAAITALAWRGSVLVWGDANGEMVIRHEGLGTQRRFVVHKDRVSDLIFTPDGEQVLSASYDGSSRMWDTHSGRMLLSTTLGYARQVSRDGSRIGYENSSGWGVWEVQRPAGYRALHTVDGLTPFIWHLDFSPDGRLLTIAKRGSLRIADVETGEILLNHRENRLEPWAQFLNDGTVLTAPRGALALRPWSLTTNGATRSLKLGPARRIELPGGHSAGIGAMSPDRQQVVFPLGGNNLAVVDFRDPEVLVRSERSWRVLRPALGPEDSWMVSGSLHGRGTILWDAETGKKQRQLQAGNAYCFASADASLLAVAGSDAYRIFETELWGVVKEISSGRGTELPNFAAFSADGSLLAIVKKNSRVQLWDPRTWQLLADFISPDPQIIYWLAFSPDARRLAVATNRDRVELWDIGALRAELGKMGLDWSDGPAVLGAGPGVTASASTVLDRRATLLLLTVAGGVAVALLCAAFVLRRQRELIRAYFDVDRQMELGTHRLGLAQAEILHGQKMKALGTLAAGIAHDFNNLLSIIRMANKLTAKQTPSDPEVQDNVRLVEKAVGQGKHLINSMLNYSREPSTGPVPYAIAEVIENDVGLLTKQFLGGLDLKLDLDRNLPGVALAKSRLEQILLNLIVNASEAMKGRGTLRVATQEAAAPAADWVLPPVKAARYVRLVVADSGPGIPPEVLPRIFEPFFTTKNVGTTRGTGLGLSMLYTLAQREGLGLRVEPEPHRGTAFSVFIPIKEESRTRDGDVQ